MTQNKELEEMINNTIKINEETGVNLLPYKCKQVFECPKCGDQLDTLCEVLQHKKKCIVGDKEIK